MRISLEALELASMALNAKVAQFEKYPSGTSGADMWARYTRALNHINDAIGEAGLQPYKGEE